MTDETNNTDAQQEPVEPKVINLPADLKETITMSFEARGYTVEFIPGFILATRDGKTERIPHSYMMKYLRAFNVTIDDVD